MGNLDIKSHIIKLESLFIEAMQDRNIERLEEFMHDDLLFVIPGGQVITKEADLENYRSGNISFSKIKVLKQSIVQHDHVITVISNLKMKGKFFDFEFDNEYNLLRVWQQSNGQWKVISGSNSPVFK